MGLDAVCTFNEFAVPIVARLAERLGLPGESSGLGVSWQHNQWEELSAIAWEVLGAQG